MPFSIEIAEFPDIGRLPGSRAQVPVLPPIKAKRYAAAGLSDALAGLVITIRNLGDVAIWFRANLGTDVTQAASANSTSLSLPTGSALTFMLPDDANPASYKLDMRAQA